MTIETIIKERMDSFSPSEKKVATEIIRHKKEVIHYDIHNFAKLCNTSSASLVRFSKKIGTKGFQDLKMQMALEMDDTSIIDFNEGVSASDTIAEISKKSSWYEYKYLKCYA